MTRKKLPEFPGMAFWDFAEVSFDPTYSIFESRKWVPDQNAGRFLVISGLRITENFSFVPTLSLYDVQDRKAWHSFNCGYLYTPNEVRKPK